MTAPWQNPVGRPDRPSQPGQPGQAALPPSRPGQGEPPVPPEPDELDGLTRFFWVRLPRRLARRSEGLGTVVGDGHVLAGLGRLGGLLPLLALGFGLLAGTAHPGFDDEINGEGVFTASLPFVIAVLAIGTLSTQLGAWCTVGFALGDFFLHHTAWTTDPFAGEGSGILSNPVIGHLLIERVPLLIEYALLGSLAVGVPLGARAMAASVGPRLELPERAKLTVTTVLMAVIGFVLARFWAAAAPLVIRPVFTWTIDEGFNQGTPPPEAIIRSRPTSTGSRGPRCWRWWGGAP